FTDDYAVITTDKGTLAIVNLNNGSTLPPVSNFAPVFYNIGNTIWGRKDYTLSAFNLDTGKRVDLPFKEIISTDSDQWLPYIDANGIGNILDLKTLDHVPVAPLSHPLPYHWSQGYLAYTSGTTISVFNTAAGKSVTLAGATAPADITNLSIDVIENRALVFFGDKPALGGIWDVITGVAVVPPMPVSNVFQSLYQALTDKNRIALAVNDLTTNKNAILLADLKAGSIRILPSENADSPSFFIGNRVLYRDLILLDLTSGEETHFTAEKYAGLELAFSPDSKLLATGGDTIRLWDAVTGAQVGVIGLQQSVHRMAYTERGIAALYDNNQLQFLNIPATSIPTSPVNGSGDLHDVAVEGNTIAAAGDVNVQLFALDAVGNVTAKTALVPNASLPPVNSYMTVAMSSRYIAAAGLTANADGSSPNTIVDLWSATTWKFVQRLDSQTGVDAYDLSFSPDGTHMALTGSGASVVWNMERSLDQPLFVTSQGLDSGHAFAGNILATLEQSWLKHTIDLYAISDGKPVGTLRRTVNISSGGGGGEGYRIPIAASADGSHVALVDAMGELVMWNVPDEAKQAAQSTDTDKANVIAYCDTLRADQANPNQNQAVKLTWSWFATDIQRVYSHIFNAIYEIKLDGTALDETKAQRSSIMRDKTNNNNWTVYYNLDVGMLKPGVHTVNYRLTWQQAINDGITDYGPNTDHPEDTGTCTFTVN
ncbi:MAG: hypothetical protein H0X30_37590, partial [Anaerolineae bacterium]|nr:hypothetical protein [Anaerolineae bacterium]